MSLAEQQTSPAPRTYKRVLLKISGEALMGEGQYGIDQATCERMAREVEMARKFANERLLGDLLPLFDSMEAGLAAAAEGDPLRAGMELTLRQLQRIAGANGLVAVAPAPGDVFNPDQHQAMSMIDAEGIAPGAVAQTFQKGWLLNERLLRPALVVVAKQD